MSLLKGKQIKDTTVDLTKLSGLGTVALVDGAVFTLPTGNITAPSSVVNRDYVDSAITTAGGDTTSLETRVSLDEVALTNEGTTRSTADASLATIDGSLETRISLDEVALTTAVTSLEEAISPEGSILTEPFTGASASGVQGAYIMGLGSSVEGGDENLVYSLTVNGKFETVTSVAGSNVTFAADYALDADDEIIIKYVSEHHIA
jgi:hypothetical protein